MRCFACTFDKVLIRFFLMMASVIVGLFSGQLLLAILALPLFLSAVLGISFLPEPEKVAQVHNIKVNNKSDDGRIAA